MADTKISNLTALAAAPSSGDFFAIVDTSASETKKLDAKYLVWASDGLPATTTGGGAVAMLSYANTGYIDVSSYVKAGASVTAVFAVAAGDILTGDASGTFQHDASAQYTYIQRSTADANGIGITLRKSRGTTASPAAVTTGDDIFLLRAYGHDGTNFLESSRISFDTEGTIGTGFVPGLLRFLTANSAGTLTQRLTIDSAGLLTVTGYASINQSNASGNVPALTITQADTTKQMIDFVSTIGTGNAIEAVGAKSLTTTHFVKVTIPGSLTRYFAVGTIA